MNVFKKHFYFVVSDVLFFKWVNVCESVGVCIWNSECVKCKTSSKTYLHFDPHLDSGSNFVLKIIQVWNIRVSKWWQNFYFWMNYPFWMYTLECGINYYSISLHIHNLHSISNLSQRVRAMKRTVHQKRWKLSFQDVDTFVSLSEQILIH